MRVFLIHCKDLIRADSGSDELCDPYVVFKVPGGKKLESKAIKKSLNPSWKTIYLMQLSMPKDTI
jgi:Ca2+-dependent lipid-binding protein